MKTKKKTSVLLPEVQIFGDIDDIIHLIKGLNKKKTVVLFRNADNGIHYAEIDGKIKLFPNELIANLKKEFRFIYFDFYPDRKRSIQLEKEVSEIIHPGNDADETEKFSGEVPINELTLTEITKNKLSGKIKPEKKSSRAKTKPSKKHSSKKT